MEFTKIFLSVVLTIACAQPVLGCDFCAIYAASEARGEIGKGFFAGVAEQFTHFGTLQNNGREIPNPGNQYLDSSITQVLLGYNFSGRFGLQLNLPVIYRSFKRILNDQVDQSSEGGLGDVSLIGNFQAYRHATVDYTFTWNILGGVKFPTGSTSYLREVAQGQDSVIGGHDLTLGTGSYDGIVGTGVFARWKRVFTSANTQCSIRSRGGFGYEFANELTWSGGPGALLVLNDNYTVALQLNASGETKGCDNFRGEKENDTGMTAVYLGPQLMVTFGEKFSAQLGVDLPVLLNNTDVQAVPDYRAHAALTWHF